MNDTGVFAGAGQVAAVVVTHNRLAQLRATVSRLMETPAHQLADIVVVDNASSDATVEEARRARPDATIVVNAGNRGFAAAVNQGARTCRAELIALLNPDVELTGPLDAACALARAALRPEAGLS